MNTRPSLDRFVTEWLHDDASTAGADRVLAAALVRVSGVHQERHRPASRFAGTPAYATLWVTAAAVLVLAVVGMNLPVRHQDGVGGLATSSSPRPASSPAAPGAYPGGDPQSGYIGIGGHSVIVDGIPLSFDMPYFWESMAPFYMAKNTQGPQGAEAIILWTTLPDAVPVGTDTASHGAYVLCSELLGLTAGGSLADVADTMSTVPGTESLIGPADVTVGGRAAKHVSLSLTYGVVSHAFCSPGFFLGWEDRPRGTFWGTATPGDTIGVWVVDVEGTRLLIEAATHWNANPGVQSENPAHHRLDTVRVTLSGPGRGRLVSRRAGTRTTRRWRASSRPEGREPRETAGGVHHHGQMPSPPGHPVPGTRATCHTPVSPQGSGWRRRPGPPDAPSALGDTCSPSRNGSGSVVAFRDPQAPVEPRSVHVPAGNPGLQARHDPASGLEPGETASGVHWR